jgi:hypothetical protein
MITDVVESPPEDEEFVALLMGEEWARTLLHDVAEFLTDYVVFSSPHEAVAVALWVVHTYLFAEFDTTPRLVIRAPEKQTGKTRLLECLTMVCRRATLVMDMSAAAFFRLIEAEGPTILQDEADAIFGENAQGNEDKRAAYNAGYRHGAVVWRVVDFKTPTQFHIFAPVALAGIGDLPDTIMDRAVVVNLRRKTQAEHVHPFRLRFAESRGSALRERLYRWSLAVVQEDENGDTQLHEPAIPDSASDRQCDIWEPLLTIADTAGEAWAGAARTAMIELTRAQASDDEDSSTSLQLLRDLRAVWGEHEDTVATAELIGRLQCLPESPWAAIEYGQPALDALKMAKRLRPYMVRPHQISSKVRGYKLADLAEVWGRYLGPVAADEGVTPLTCCDRSE